MRRWLVLNQLLCTRPFEALTNTTSELMHLHANKASGLIFALFRSLDSLAASISASNSESQQSDFYSFITLALSSALIRRPLSLSPSLSSLPLSPP